MLAGIVDVIKSTVDKSTCDSTFTPLSTLELLRLFFFSSADRFRFPAHSLSDNVSLRNSADDDDVLAEGSDSSGNEDDSALASLSEARFSAAFRLHCELHRRLAALLDAPRFQLVLGSSLPVCVCVVCSFVFLFFLFVFRWCLVLVNHAPVVPLVIKSSSHKCPFARPSISPHLMYSLGRVQQYLQCKYYHIISPLLQIFQLFFSRSNVETRRNRFGQKCSRKQMCRVCSLFEF